MLAVFAVAAHTAVTMARPSVWDRVVVRAVGAHARHAYRRFVAATRDARRTQERLLQRHLRRHTASDFGREHRFDRIGSYEAFADAVPVAGYEAFAAYIERLRRGDFQALLGPRQKVLMFALTSGTTAEPKTIPVTREFLRGYQRGWNAWGVKAILDHPGSFLRGIVQVTSPMCDHASEAGIPCGAITGLLAASQKRLVRKYYVAPLAVADIHDATAKYYTIMRLAVPRDVAFLVTANPATLLLLARTADTHKQILIRDIHDGTLATEFAIPPHVRQTLAPRLSPDPALARRLEHLVRQHGRLRPHDYWNLSFVAHWTGGTMGLYRPFFPEWFGDAPVRDIGLLASEGRMTIPIADGTPSGVLDVTTQFFEFIPAEDYDRPGSSVRPGRTLRCHQVRPGHEYFLVLTNASGLCRYDIGDRVRVTGWFAATPMVEFLSKGAHTASLAGEKLTEDQVVSAMQQAARPAGLSCECFVLAPQFAEQPYYRLYLDGDEIGGVAVKRDAAPPAAAMGDAIQAAAADDLAEQLDRALRRINLEYASKRASQRLGPVALHLLPPGFLAARDATLRAASASRDEQFKHQYLLPRPGIDADWPQHLAHAPRPASPAAQAKTPASR